jgi:hypothetical protein
MAQKGPRRLVWPWDIQHTRGCSSSSSRGRLLRWSRRLGKINPEKAFMVFSWCHGLNAAPGLLCEGLSGMSSLIDMINIGSQSITPISSHIRGVSWPSFVSQGWAHYTGEFWFVSDGVFSHVGRRPGVTTLVLIIPLLPMYSQAGKIEAAHRPVQIRLTIFQPLSTPHLSRILKIKKNRGFERYILVILRWDILGKCLNAHGKRNKIYPPTHKGPTNEPVE